MEAKYPAQRVMDLFYPPRCPLCGGLLKPPRRLRGECGWRELVCDSCENAIPWVREPVCFRCGRPMGDEGRTREFCPECTGREKPYAGGHCTFLYRDALRRAVLQMKFHNRREYLDFFAAAMARSGQVFLDRTRPDVMVPVPASKGKRRERGFDQCVLLTEKLSRRTGIPARTGLLIRNHATRPQSGLGLAARRANVRGAFAVSREGEGVMPERILLVDDIFTTGSTAEECCRTLLAAGAKQVFLMMLCTGNQ